MGTCFQPFFHFGFCPIFAPFYGQNAPKARKRASFTGPKAPTRRNKFLLVGAFGPNFLSRKKVHKERK